MVVDLATHVKMGLVEKLEQLWDEVRQIVEPLSDKQLWSKPIEPGNSVGHLVLHLTGNLNHFVGAQLGKTGYVRDREREFTDATPPPKTELLGNLAKAVATFRAVVSGLSAAQLADPHPHEKFGSVFQALLHLETHFALHRGQMTYIVRSVK